MIKRFFTLGVVGLLTYSVPTMPVKAISKTPAEIATISDTDQARTSGLISKCSLSISASNKAMQISGTTESTLKMKSIGYKDISIEYSSDKTNWHTEKEIDDLLKSYSISYPLDRYEITVKGGYYYRVTLNHYAKESGLFGTSQSVNNTSNSVWID